jgi:HAD superfamily hydrolase (TIGR01458 family)
MTLRDLVDGPAPTPKFSRLRRLDPVRTPRALLVDIDGVLVVSWKPLPGALDALAALRSAGVPLRFLTNTTSRTKAAITESLREAGFEVSPDEVLTAAAATAAHLTAHRPAARCLFLNSGDDITVDLPGVTIVERDAPADRVDVVIVGGAGPEFSYETLNHALACLLGGAALVAMHRNLTWRTSRGLQLDAGGYVAALEAAAGVEATVIGKPAAAMFEAALTSLGLDATETAMIGDDIDSDVRGAQALGITGVQVRTGKFRPRQLDTGAAPDVMLDSFADVPRWMEQPSRP